MQGCKLHLELWTQNPEEQAKWNRSDVCRQPSVLHQPLKSMAWWIAGGWLLWAALVWCYWRCVYIDVPQKNKANRKLWNMVPFMINELDRHTQNILIFVLMSSPILPHDCLELWSKFLMLFVFVIWWLKGLKTTKLTLFILLLVSIW